MSDPTDNVILFHGQTRLAIPPERALNGALEADLKEVVVVGRDADGELWIGYSQAKICEAYHLLQKGALDLLDLDD